MLPEIDSALTHPLRSNGEQQMGVLRALHEFAQASISCQCLETAFVTGEMHLHFFDGFACVSNIPALWHETHACFDLPILGGKLLKITNAVSSRNTQSSTLEGCQMVRESITIRRTV